MFAGLCSNQKFLSNLESSFKKLPASSQQKVDLYHVFGVITETFRGSNGSEDLEKYFSKVYENANETGLVRPLLSLFCSSRLPSFSRPLTFSSLCFFVLQNRSTPPQYLQALSSGQDRQRGRTDGQGERRHRSSGFPSSENVPTVGDDLERMARECEGAWKTKEDLLQLLREARNDDGVMEDPEMRARIRVRRDFLLFLFFSAKLPEANFPFRVLFLSGILPSLLPHRNRTRQPSTLGRISSDRIPPHRSSTHFQGQFSPFQHRCSSPTRRRTQTRSTTTG